MPHWPYCLNFHGQASVLPTLLNCVGSTFAGNGWPLYFVQRRLGVEGVDLDGPPSMNRKMTLLALAASGGFFGAKGSVRPAASGARPSSASRAASAAAPNPLAERRSISRRVTGRAARQG